MPNPASNLHHHTCPRCTATVSTVCANAEVSHRCPAKGNLWVRWVRVREMAKVAS